MHDLQAKVDEVANFISENSSFFSFFVNKQNKLELKQKKIIYHYLWQQLQNKNNEYKVLVENLYALKRRSGELKTLKQRESIVRRRLANLGIYLRKRNGGIY